MGWSGVQWDQWYDPEPRSVSAISARQWASPNASSPTPQA